MNSDCQSISRQELLVHLQEKSACLLDIRPVDFYNGWSEAGAPRGGHIPGAKSFPLKWFSYIDWLELFEKKGLSDESLLILYGVEETLLQECASSITSSGFRSVQIYSRFQQDWIPESSLPIVTLARYEKLVSPQWLEKLLDGGQPDHYENDHYVLCHVHYQNINSYLEGHIPGAVELDTNCLESAQSWNRRTPGELKKSFEEHGITENSTVVLYGKFSFPDNRDPFPGSAAGHLGAIRCAFIMMTAGIKDVRVLNGGMQSWLDSGLPIEKSPRAKSPVSPYLGQIWGRPELAVDMEEARSILNDPSANLVSVRSWPEYTGEVSGYHYIEKKGRIPGSVFGNCGSDAYHMENYRNPDHTTREFHEIRSEWISKGITPDRRNAFYCGTGWRGSEAWFNAWLMGWDRAAVYDGGWFEWSSDPDNPIETGIPQSD